MQDGHAETDDIAVWTVHYGSSFAVRLKMSEERNSRSVRSIPRVSLQSVLCNNRSHRQILSDFRRDGNIVMYLPHLRYHYPVPFCTTATLPSYRRGGKTFFYRFIHPFLPSSPVSLSALPVQISPETSRSARLRTTEHLVHLRTLKSRYSVLIGRNHWLL